MRAFRVILSALLTILPSLAFGQAGFSRPAVLAQCPCLYAGAAPDWSDHAYFVGAYSFEQLGPPPSVNGLYIDESSNNNRPDPNGSATTLTSRASRVPHGCKAVAITATNAAIDCQAPDCTEGDFCPIDSPFTSMCWIEPDDTVAERWTISTNATGGITGAGHNIGWKQSGAGTGKYLFQIDVDAGANETELLTNASYAPDILRHHAARFFYRPENANGVMHQLVNGLQDASTAVSTPIQECDEFSIGIGDFNVALTGTWDECIHANVALDDPSICKIAVCGITGCSCECDWTGVPADYKNAPLHDSFGGDILCDLPACDSTTPSTILPTTTTTSTSSSTSSTAPGETTTTSTSSTTSTSTSSTTSTTSTSTSTTTSTSTSSTTTTSTSTSTSTSLTTTTTEPGATTTTSTSTTTTTSTSSSTSSTTSSTTSTSTSSTTTTTLAGDFVVQEEGADNQQTLAVAMTGDGDLIAGGFSPGTVTFEGTGGTPITLTGTAGRVDGYVVRYDFNGEPEWAKQLVAVGVGAQVVVEGVAGDPSGNVYAVGRYAVEMTAGATTLTSAGSQDIFVVKWNAAGTQQWAVDFGNTASDQGLAVAVDSAGNVLLTGSYQDEITFGGGTLTAGKITDDLPTIFLTKLDDDGAHVWSQSLTGSATELGLALAIGTSDDVVLAGTFSDELDPGDGDLNTFGSIDGFLAQYDSTGTHEWTRHIGGTNIDGVADVDTDGTTVVATGRFRGTADFGGTDLVANSSVSDTWIASYTAAAGAHNWSVSGGTSLNEDGGNGLGFDDDGTTFVTGEFLGNATFGSFTLTNAGGRDIFVLELDGSGTITGAEQWGGTGNDEGQALNAWDTGDVLVGGFFRTTTNFDFDALLSAGGSDGFTARIMR